MPALILAVLLADAVCVQGSPVVQESSGQNLADSLANESSSPTNRAQGANNQDYLVIAQQVIRIVEDNFYSTDKFNQAYQLAKQQLLDVAQTCQNRQEFATSMNRCLASLKASHTYYLTPEEVEYYHLAAIFEKVPAVQAMLKEQHVTYPTIGVVTQWIQDQWVVVSVLPDGPSDGLLQVGDVLRVTGNLPFSPVASLRSRIDHPTQFQIKRSGTAMTLTIVPKLVRPKQELLDAMNSSIKIHKIEGRKIGYVHIYSYAGIEYQNALEESIAWGVLKDADALVIDLRFGPGGADTKYLNIFNQNIPKLIMIDPKGNQTVIDPQWRKPAVLLVDPTSRSGKEVFAYGAKKFGYAKIVGGPTAGAVLAGSPFPISNGDLLYLAVRDVIVDGIQLEGKPVQPDISVVWNPIDCNGRDQQIETSLLEAAKMSKSASKQNRP